MCDDFMAEMGAEVFVQALLIKSGGQHVLRCPVGWKIK